MHGWLRLSADMFAHWLSHDGVASLVSFHFVAYYSECVCFAQTDTQQMNMNTVVDNSNNISRALSNHNCSGHEEGQYWELPWWGLNILTYNDKDMLVI